MKWKNGRAIYIENGSFEEILSFFLSLFFRKEFVESASPILLKSQSGRQEGNIYLYIKEEENKQREKDDEPSSDDIRYSHSLFFPLKEEKKKLSTSFRFSLPISLQHLMRFHESGKFSHLLHKRRNVYSLIAGLYNVAAPLDSTSTFI
jgi:hypothetical protein